MLFRLFINLVFFFGYFFHLAGFLAWVETPLSQLLQMDPLISVFLHHPLNQLPDLAGDSLLQLPPKLYPFLAGLLHDHFYLLAFKGRGPIEHRVKDNPRAEHVDPVIVPLALEDLRSHVPRSTATILHQFLSSTPELR